MKNEKFKVGDLMAHDIFGWRGFVIAVMDAQIGDLGQIVEVFWSHPHEGKPHVTQYTTRAQISCIQKLTGAQ